MPNTVIYLFPGQGSQNCGMGAELFQHFPHYVEQANAQLGYSIEELCLENPEGKLNQTQYTQPALYTVNALSYYHQLEQNPRLPDFVAGHSLGEYNALLAAGAFDFLTGLQLVQKRGALMAEAHGGGMAAVIGLSFENLSELIQQSGITTIDLANLNTPQQTVLSGPKNDIDQLIVYLKEAKARVIPLRVSAAFHSRYMKEAKEQFYQFLQSFTFAPLTIPTMANANALPYRDDAIAANLAEQIDHSVRWVELIRYLLREENPCFQEIGPGQVLTRMIPEIQKV